MRGKDTDRRVHGSQADMTRYVKRNSLKALTRSVGRNVSSEIYVCVSLSETMTNKRQDTFSQREAKLTMQKTDSKNT